MGNCCGFCNKEASSYEDLTPDRETIRRRQAEAAEKRIAEQQQRGIKDIESVKRQQRRALELEKLEQEAAASGAQPTLRVRIRAIAISPFKYIYVSVSVAGTINPRRGNRPRLDRLELYIFSFGRY